MKRIRRAPDYLRWLRNQTCVVCGSSVEGQNVPHHEPPKQMGGANGSDWKAVSACPVCHRIRHDEGGERAAEVKRIFEESRLDQLVTFLETEEAKYPDELREQIERLENAINEIWKLSLAVQSKIGEESELNTELEKIGEIAANTLG